MYIHDVKRIQKTLRRERRIDIFGLVCCLFFFSLFLWTTFAEVHVLIVLLMLISLAGSLLVIRAIIKNNRLLKHLAYIEENISLIRTYEVKTYRPRIDFLIQQEIRAHPTFLTGYSYGMTVMDSKKNKYYYFFNDLMSYDNDNANIVRSKFSGDVCIECYENTRIIKKINKDPNYVRVKWRWGGV